LFTDRPVRFELPDVQIRRTVLSSPTVTSKPRPLASCGLHDEGHSLREIATTLEAEGPKPKRGDSRHPITVVRIVRRAAAA
jgi:hypothetical protein